MSYEDVWRIVRVKLFESGHTLEEIENLPLSFIGDVLGYEYEMNRIEQKRSKLRKSLGGTK